MLKRRYEYWLCALGLMRIGAIQIPATHQLQEKDISYRVNAADARTLICVGEEELLTHVRASKEKCPHLRVTAALGGKHEGFEDFDRLLAEAPDAMDGCYDPSPEDVMLIYFTSGTTGMPKMLAHDFRYGLGHLITGAFWHNLTDKSIHITTADSGWAKCGWGKFYGQWMPARSTSSTISTASTPRRCLPCWPSTMSPASARRQPSTASSSRRISAATTFPPFSGPPAPASRSTRRSTTSFTALPA